MSGGGEWGRFWGSTRTSQIAKDNKINKRFAANRRAGRRKRSQEAKTLRHKKKKNSQKGERGRNRYKGQAGKGESQLLQVCKFYLCVLLWAYLKSQSFGKSDSDSNSELEGEAIGDGASIWQGYYRPCVRRVVALK